MKDSNDFFRSVVCCTARILPIFFAAVLLSAICGCSSLIVNPKGARIAASHQIPIETETQQYAHHQALDLLVQYQYLATGNTLKISGNVRFASSIQMNFTIIRSFNLQLLIGDAQGVILATRNIAGATFRQTEDELTFQDSFTLPDGAQMMAFAYRGSATGGGSPGRRRSGDSGGVETSFFDFPVLR